MNRFFLPPQGDFGKKGKGHQKRGTPFMENVIEKRLDGWRVVRFLPVVSLPEQGIKGVCRTSMRLERSGQADVRKIGSTSPSCWEQKDNKMLEGKKARQKTEEVTTAVNELKRISRGGGW